MGLLKDNNGETYVLGMVVITLILLLVAIAVRLSDGFGQPTHYKPSRTQTRIYTPPEKTRYKCVYCSGRGLIKCSLCGGRGGKYGYNNRWRNCVSCDGTGLQTCLLCNGMGYREY